VLEETPSFDGKRVLGADHLGPAIVPGPYYLPGAGFGGR
jgi:hypothetical protein